MFGYVKPFKPDMRICEFDTYKAVYCGLCHQLGKSFGPFSKFTLNYDFSFLALLMSAVKPDTGKFENKICSANPIKKKLTLSSCSELEFAASVAMIIFYYKICDNIADSGFFSKIGFLIFKPIAYFYKRRAMKIHPELDKIIGEQMKKQSEIEKSTGSGIDISADPTAKALSGVFSLLSDDSSQIRVLSRFGYLLGRWIYLIDAVDDFEDDVKSGSYNPFVNKLSITSINDKTISEMQTESKKILNQTIVELAGAYELITLNRYKSIIDNIVYLGLKNTQENIYKKRRRKPVNE